jgi:hypothetical protein
MQSAEVCIVSPLPSVWCGKSEYQTFLFLRGGAPSRQREVRHSDSGWDLRNRRVGALGLHLCLYSAIAMHASLWRVKHKRRRAKIRSHVRVCVCVYVGKSRADSG